MVYPLFWITAPPPFTYASLSPKNPLLAHLLSSLSFVVVFPSFARFGKID